ncbi:MAG TPA: hypothetical protein VGQ94_03745 [Terriglobales bacterium]|nr:hypothetical protein [Terriglobales bacterium]
MKTIGKTRMQLAIGVVVVGVLTLFLPVIEINVPIFGKVQWSALDVVSRLSGGSKKGKPSFIDVAKGAKRVWSEVHQTASSTSPKKIPSGPLGIMLAPFIPLEIAMTYAALLGAIMALCVRPMQRILGFVSAVGAVTSTVALLSVFLFSNAIQQSMDKEMKKPEMGNNPFARLLQAFMQGIRIDPGVALYLLVAVMAGLFAIWKWDSLARTAFVPEQSPGATAGR